MEKPIKIFGFLIIACLLQAFAVSNSYAQFNNDFEIERHYLAMENFLDWKAYQNPFSWKYEWDTTQSGMLASVGSLSLYEFYYTSEIRLAKELGSLVSFQYDLVEDSFYRKAPLYQEIAFRVGTEDYAASLIGFPSYDKKNGQVGYAVSYGKRHTLNSVRLSLSDQYSIYNERNVNSEKNSVDGHFRKTPLLSRLEALWFWDHHLYIKTDLKQISQAVYKIDDPEQLLEFEGNEYEITIDWREEDSWVLGTTAYHKEEYRTQVPTTSSQDLPDLDQTILLSWLDIYFHMQASLKSLITIGVLSSQFLNNIDSSYSDQRYDCHLRTFQVYGIWQKAKSDWFYWLYSLQAGQAELDKSYEGISETVDDENLEMKAGIGVMMMEELNYRLLVNTTWDLDFFETRQWDGGNVQLQMVF